jgi:hypothetical protein
VYVQSSHWTEASCHKDWTLISLTAHFFNKELRFKGLGATEYLYLGVDRRCGKGVLGRNWINEILWKSKWLGCNVTVKQLNVNFDIRECNYNYKQWEFLIRFRHPYIVQLVGVTLPTNDDGRWSRNIVMELTDRDLLDLIDKRLDEKMMVGGVVTCHGVNGWRFAWFNW